MELSRFSETSVSYHNTTRCHNPENSTWNSLAFLESFMQSIFRKSCQHVSSYCSEHLQGEVYFREIEKKSHVGAKSGQYGGTFQNWWVLMGGKSLYQKRVVIMQNPLVFRDMIVSDWCATVNTPKPVNKSAWLIIFYWRNNCEAVSKSLQTDRPERELQMVHTALCH
jgi:hypothetical protein